MSSPSWYDLLGVAPDATPAEIKAAWRDATDKFEPGTGATQFRLFNEAADVLLDPERRSAYDAEIGLAAEPVVDVAKTPAPEPEPVLEAEPAPAPDEEPEPEPDETPETGPDETPEPDAEPDAPGRTTRLRALATSTVALVVLGALALVSVVFAAVAFTQTDLGEKADEYKAGRNAQSAAVKALTAVLSYDYRQLDTPAKLEASLNAVTANMTPELAARYRTAFTTVCRPDIDSPATAVARKSVVSSAVEDPAIIDAGTQRVRLLVFVSQTTSNSAGGPSSRSSQVVATLVDRGGRWLLDSVETKSQTPPQCVDPSAPATPTTP